MASYRDCRSIGFAASRRFVTSSARQGQPTGTPPAADTVLRSDNTAEGVPATKATMTADHEGTGRDTTSDHATERRRGTAMIDTVFFDVGGTILDESREFDDLGGLARRSTAHVLGGLRCGDRPGSGLAGDVPGLPARFRSRGRARTPGGRWPAGVVRRRGSLPRRATVSDRLEDQGLFVGLAGNQPAHAEAILRALDLPVDVIGTSDGWGVAKPSPAFFEQVVREGGGDRILDPVRRRSARQRCAPGHGGRYEDVPDPACSVGSHPRPAAVAEQCLFRIDSLDELPSLVAKHNAAGG